MQTQTEPIATIVPTPTSNQYSERKVVSRAEAESLATTAMLLDVGVVPAYGSTIVSEGRGSAPGATVSEGSTAAAARLATFQASIDSEAVGVATESSWGIEKEGAKACDCRPASVNGVVSIGPAYENAPNASEKTAANAR